MQPIQSNLKTIKYLTQEEVSRLFSKIQDKRDRAMFNVVYKYGLRASEVGLLKIDDVDPCEDGKGERNRERIIKMIRESPLEAKYESRLDGITPQLNNFVHSCKSVNFSLAFA